MVHRVTDALNTGAFEYDFEPRVPAAALMCELCCDRDLRVGRGTSPPPGSNAGTIFLPADSVIRFELVRGENLYVRRGTGNNAVNYSLRTWIRE